MPIPESLTFLNLFVAQLCLMGVAFLVLLVRAGLFGQFHLIELRLAGMILLGNSALFAFAVWRYDTSFWIILVWTIGSLLLASAIAAGCLFAFNVLIRRIQGDI